MRAAFGPHPAFRTEIGMSGLDPELLVMAAGLGSRFGGLKQLAPIGPRGEKIIDYSVFDAITAGVERVVFVIRRSLETEFHERVGARFAKVVDIDYAFQETDLLPEGFSVPVGRVRPWGTGHAVLAAKGVVRGSVIVINADDFYGRNTFAVLAGWLSGPDCRGSGHHAMVAFRMANTLSAAGPVARGVCRHGADGLLIGVSEQPTLSACEGGVGDGSADRVPVFTGDEPVSMNIWGFRQSIFGQLEELFAGFMERRGQEVDSEFHLPTAVDWLIRTGRASVRVLSTPDRWCGVTYRGDAEVAAAHIRGLTEAGQYPMPLWSL